MVTIKKSYIINIILLIIVLLLTACSGISDTTYHNLTINIKPEGSGDVTPAAREYQKNKELELKAKANLGWKFKEWQGELESTENPYSGFTMDSDYNISAVFEVAYPLVGQVNISNKTADSALKSTTFRETKLNTKDKSDVSHAINNMVDNSSQPNYKDQEIILKYKSTLEFETRKELEGKYNLKRLKKLSVEENLFKYQLPAGQNVAKAVEMYKKLSSVEYAQPNYIYRMTTMPNDDDYQNGYQWGAVNLNLEAAWDEETGSTQEINVAVIDTGIIPGHPDLKDNISPAGYDFVASDDTPYDLTVTIDDGNKIYSTNGHGTHVAGIIGAVGNNGLGVTGTNWHVNLIPIRVLGANGEGTTDNFVQAINYAAGKTVENDNGTEVTISEEVDIINLSLGDKSRGESPAMKEAVEQAAQAGIVIFAAAGNDGQREVFPPASYDETIAVGAVNETNQQSYFSVYGPKLDLVAPGGGYAAGIWSTSGSYNNGFQYNYSSKIGTSMATPYVSGVASLLLAKGVAPDQVESRLKETAVDLGPQGYDEQYGFGLVDAYGALLDKKLSPPQVFLASKSGDKLTVQSKLQTVANKERYKFAEVKAEEVYIVGWRDTNGSGQIDQGDYYGQVGPITVRNNQVQRNDLQLNYIGPETTDIPTMPAKN